VLDRNPEALRRIATQLGGRVRTLFSTRDVVELLCRRADLVIATVLVPGATAPKLISAQTVKAMKPGTVIVDVAIDQGGCAETSRPTTHSHPTFVVDNVVHYCVTNMPGAVPRTSTFALSNATTSFILALADNQCLQWPDYLSRRCGCAQAALHASRSGIARFHQSGHRITPVSAAVRSSVDFDCR
jgi:alanine dehydrogenase